MTSGPIDFAALAAALLERAEQFVAQWIPDGHRDGHEWIGGKSSKGGIGDSFKVNLNTGRWAYFAGDQTDAGGDLISLYAWLNNVNNRQAALVLMRDMGWMPVGDPPAPVQTSAARASEVSGDGRPEPPTSDDAPAPKRAKGSDRWRPIVPVPKHAPTPTSFVFGFKDETKGGRWVEVPAARTWLYEFEGERYGYVARIERVNSGGVLVKDTVARTWCEDLNDPRRTQCWAWKSWDEPRPLYVAAGLLSGNPREVPVVLVEGEKCAEAGHQLLGHEFDFVTWPGGAKAWQKAGWGWLKGRAVFMWPDCDAQRERLTKAEREAGVDPSSKPIKPQEKQPGYAAMVGIGSHLVADQWCTAFMCRIPAPGEVSDGWDIADAIASGWTADQVRDFIRGALEFLPPEDEARAKAAAASPPTKAGASDSSAAADAEEDERRAWRVKLIKGQGGIKPVRENVVLALDGMRDPMNPDRWIPGAPEASGVIGWNEFTSDVVKLKPTPWGTPAGIWTEVDDLLMGEWLTRVHWLPSMPRGTLEEAVRMVAHRHAYHPVRDYLGRLEWDGEPRLRTWLRRACLEEDEHDDTDELQRYLTAAGTYYLMGMCQRALEPGCKFDYMLVLESPEQGRGKSSLFRLLAGEWFADTGLVLGDKDSYQQLQGRWLYEMGELDALSRADITRVKQYIASQSDYFRASFDRRARAFPRQVVFGGTTNDDHYLVDPTGNRRFWPVRVTRRVDLEWVRSVRDQLFAEALERLKAGERFFPLPDEEDELFVPQQQARMVESPIEGRVVAFLYPRGAGDGEGASMNEVSLQQLLGRIGIPIEKLGPGRWHEKQAAATLKRLTWKEGPRKGPRNGPRLRTYVRPKPDIDPYSDDVPAAAAAGASRSPTEGGDDYPF